MLCCLSVRNAGEIMEKPECPEEVAAGGGKVHWKAKREWALDWLAPPAWLIRSDRDNLIIIASSALSDGGD